MPDTIQPYIEAIREQPDWVLYSIAALVLLLVLWAAWRLLKQPRELLAFKSERGEVTVVRRAIADLIQKAAAHTPGVEKCRSRIRKRRGKLAIDLRIHLRANHDLREVERRLESQIVDTLRYSLGFGQLGKFTTRVVALVGDPDPVRHYEELPRPKEEESYAPVRPNKPAAVPVVETRHQEEERRRQEVAETTPQGEVEHGDEEPLEPTDTQENLDTEGEQQRSGTWKI